jgi:hypothetical protein
MADAAAVAATAVLDVLMPHVANDDGQAAERVAEAARAVRTALVNAGASREEALDAAVRVGAEIARWMGGRGLRLPRRGRTLR